MLIGTVFDSPVWMIILIVVIISRAGANRWVLLSVTNFILMDAD